MSKRRLVALAALVLTAPLLAHDGDLKLLHKQPARPGTGFRNSLRATPARGALTDNERLALTGFGAHRVTLLSWLTLSDFGVPSGGNGNSLWGYTSPGGRRYALMGLSTGTAFVDITAPNAPVVVDQISGPNSLWRDIRTYEQYAYAISEGGNGIQIIDMTQIDSGIVDHVAYLSDVGTANTHTLVINEATGFLYRAGGGSNGLRIYNLEPNPASPTYVASWPDRYVHEASVYNYTSGPFAGHEIVFACGGLNGGFEQTGLHILDVTNKASIQTLSISFYPNAEFCHQGWLSDNGQYFYINDELYNGPQTTQVMNVSNLNSPSFVTTFSNGNSSIAHNLYLHDDHMYSASYKDGLRVWDLSANPTAPTEVAWFDTAPLDDAPTFNGLWNVYPYFGNGLAIGSDLESGLFVWYVGDPRVTITAVGGAPTELDPSGQTIPVQLQELTPGEYQSGTAQLHYDTGSGWTSVPLAHVGGLDFTATFPALGCGSDVSYYFSAESTDGTVWVEPIDAPMATFVATAVGATTPVFGDDFEVDLGWTPSNVGASSGTWQRGIPVNDPGWDYDPTSDGDGSGRCWLTQNSAGNTDVDGGAVRLTSPTFDMSAANLVRYEYFLRLTSTAGEDRMLVEANSNGGVGAWAQVAVHDTDGGLTWRAHSLDAGDFAAAGVSLTATMRLRFTVNDADTQTIVEAGLDAFEVSACSGSGSFCDASDGSLSACPCSNPGDPNTGCDIAQGTGGVGLTVVGQDTVATQATLSASGFPPAASTTALVIRSSSLDPSSPVVFGDGLRCLNSSPLVRLAATASVSGTSTHVFGHGAGAGTFYYQVWFRNTPSTFCDAGAAFNLSNGRTISWP